MRIPHYFLYTWYSSYGSRTILPPSPHMFFRLDFFLDGWPGPIPPQSSFQIIRDILLTWLCLMGPDRAVSPHNLLYPWYFSRGSMAVPSQNLENWIGSVCFRGVGDVSLGGAYRWSKDLKGSCRNLCMRGPIVENVLQTMESNIVNYFKAISWFDGEAERCCCFSQLFGIVQQPRMHCFVLVFVGCESRGFQKG